MKWVDFNQRIVFWPFKGAKDLSKPNRLTWLKYDVKEVVLKRCTEQEGRAKVHALPSPSDCEEESIVEESATEESGGESEEENRK